MNANTQQSFLGRYRLVKVLGQGAMGVVYEAVDTRLNRTVAIKTVLRSHLADETTANEYATRFEREAQAAARLAHPHVVTVYDFGEHEDISYIVMEFVRGRELNQAFEQGERFSLPEAIRIMRELLQALDYAHQQGIVHRDIKPANVMLDAGGHVKLTDFGVARVANATQDRTMPGTLVGTPSYMSPEQILGLAVGSRADLFAAGVILYQFLTGKRPFAGGGPFGVQRKIVQDDPETPSHVNPLLPAAFDAIVAKALAKQPEHRYESAAAFAEDLERMGATLPREVPLIDLDLPDDGPSTGPVPGPVPAAWAAPAGASPMPPVPHDAPTQVVDLGFAQAAPLASPARPAPPPAAPADAALTTDIPLNDLPADPEATVLMLRPAPTEHAPRPPAPATATPPTPPSVPPTATTPSATAPAPSRLSHLPKPAGGSMEAVAARPSQPAGGPPARTGAQRPDPPSGSPAASPSRPVAAAAPPAAPLPPGADQPATIFVGAPPGAQPLPRGPAPAAAPGPAAAATRAAAHAATPAPAAARMPARTFSTHPAPVQRPPARRSPSWLPWAAGATVVALAVITWWLAGRSSSPRPGDAGYGQASTSTSTSTSTGVSPGTPSGTTAAPHGTPGAAVPTAAAPDPTRSPATDAAGTAPPAALPEASAPAGATTSTRPAGPAATTPAPPSAAVPGTALPAGPAPTAARPAPEADGHRSPTGSSRPPRTAPAATASPQPPRGEAAPRATGQEARCNDLLQRMQLGEPLTAEQTGYFQTRCTR